MSNIITKETVKQISKLAKLDFSDEEIEGFAHQLADIVHYVQKLEELDTDGVEPTFHTLNVYNVFRKDEEVNRPDNMKDVLLGGAPSHIDGYFHVPDVPIQQN